MINSTSFFSSSAFNETGVDNVHNRVSNILLGGAIHRDKHLRVIKINDSNFYDHY